MRDKLLQILDLVPKTHILVVGDIILDRYIWGSVERISPEAPVPVVDVSKTEDRLGGAGNVVRNLKSIGAEVTLCGFIGDDEDGKKTLETLRADGVKPQGIVVDPEKPTILKTRVIAHHQQVVRIDRELKGDASPELSAKLQEVLETSLDHCNAVIVSDYGKGAISQPVLDTLGAAIGNGRLSLKSRPLFLDPHPRNYARYKRISVAKPNKREAELASGVKIRTVDQAFEAARVLNEKWNAELMVITLGELGMVLVPAGSQGGIHLETAAREVFDVSGAGDTVTAMFTAALATGATPVEAGMLANLAAGIVVGEVGTAAIELKRLKEVIRALP